MLKNASLLFALGAVALSTALALTSCAGDPGAATGNAEQAQVRPPAPPKPEPKPGPPVPPPSPPPRPGPIDTGDPPPPSAPNAPK